MDILFKIFQEYGWWGLLGIALCIGLFISSKYVSKKLSKDVTSGLENVGKKLTDQLAEQNQSLTDQLAEQNKTLTNTIIDQQQVLINHLVQKQNNDSKNHENMLNDKITVLSREINHMLKDIMNIHNSQRAFIIEFHNSYQNLSGVPFAKYSCTYEKFEKGLQPLANNCNSLPFSQLAEIVSEIIKSKTNQLVYYDIEEMVEDSIALYTILKCDNCKSVIYTALYDKDNQIIGLLVLEYHKHIDLDLINLNQLQFQAAELTSIINIRYKYSKDNTEIS